MSFSKLRTLLERSAYQSFLEVLYSSDFPYQTGLMQEMIAEVRASPVYSTVTLASGPASAVHLEETSKQADDHVDVCCQVPEEIFKDDARDTTMFGTTSMLSFSELVGKVSLDRVVKVIYKYKEQKVGHIAVVGPNGFQLCTCLQLLRTGL